MLMNLFALMVAAFLGGATAPIEELNFYPMTTVVVELDGRTDSVVCVDFNGNEWSFEGIEDWCVGDYATMMMCDNGTSEIHDDIICDVQYDGWLDGNFGDILE
jgi:hypothetical protein